MLHFRKPTTTPNLIARNLIILALTCAIALTTACRQTGNRLNIGVISDPRTQFDPNDATGNQGTVTPTDASGSSGIVDPSLTDPSLTPIPSGGSGSNSSSNTNQQTSGSTTPGGIFTQTPTQTATLATSPLWALAIGVDGAFALQHRAKAYGSVDLQLNGVRTIQPDGSLVLTITDRQGDGLPGIAIGGVISGVEWTDHLILLNGDDLAAHEIIPLTIAATCPRSDINAIWLEASTIPETVSAGVLAYTASTGTAFQTVAVEPLTGQALIGQSFVNKACSKASTLDLTANTSTSGSSDSIVLAETGVGVLTNGTTQSLAFAVHSPMTLGGLAGDYIGMHGPHGATQIAALRCNDLGHCSGDAIASNASLVIQLDALNTLANGISTGTLTDHNGLASPVACISDINADLDGRVNILACQAGAPAAQVAVFVRNTP